MECRGVARLQHTVQVVSQHAIRQSRPELHDFTRCLAVSPKHPKLKGTLPARTVWHTCGARKTQGQLTRIPSHEPCVLLGVCSTTFMCSTCSEAVQIQFQIAIYIIVWSQLLLSSCFGLIFGLLRDRWRSLNLAGSVPLRHNDVRDLLARDLTEVCSGVATEPPLQPLSGERFRARSTNTDEGARLDISARGFWTRGEEAFFFLM